MTIREELEALEAQSLSPYASLSRNTKGRERMEQECDIRPSYQRDRDRIIHCKAFRRLMHKTQVFIKPNGDHIRTRLTHTLEVSQTARTIAKSLSLNEELAEAIALGHDLGHAPFGHAGEDVLNSLCGEGFRHSEQSVRIVERLEKAGRGLNLTWEVRDGIRNHQTGAMPNTPEGRVVRLSDKIAYINHDVDDAIHTGVLREEDIPMEYRKILGFSPRKRMNTMIHDIVRNSKDTADIFMSPTVEKAMGDLREFMFVHVYRNPTAKGDEEQVKEVVRRLFLYYMEHIDQLPYKFLNMLDLGESKERVVCDYVAGMTDSYAIAKFQEFFVPKDLHF